MDIDDENHIQFRTHRRYSMKKEYIHIVEDYVSGASPGKKVRLVNNPPLFGSAVIIIIITIIINPHTGE
jgi:hypothetical protein